MPRGLGNFLNNHSFNQILHFHAFFQMFFFIFHIYITSMLTSLIDPISQRFNSLNQCSHQSSHVNLGSELGISMVYYAKVGQNPGSQGIENRYSAFARPRHYIENIQYSRLMREIRVFWESGFVCFQIHQRRYINFNVLKYKLQHK